MARLRQVAMAREALPVRSCEATVQTLSRRISPGPCPSSVVRFCSGICFQGRDFICLRSFFWLPLTITM